MSGDDSRETRDLQEEFRAQGQRMSYHDVQKWKEGLTDEQKKQMMEQFAAAKPHAVKHGIVPKDDVDGLTIDGASGKGRHMQVEGGSWGANRRGESSDDARPITGNTTPWLKNENGTYVLYQILYTSRSIP